MPQVWFLTNATVRAGVCVQHCFIMVLVREVARSTICLPTAICVNGVAWPLHGRSPLHAHSSSLFLFGFLIPRRFHKRLEVVS